MTVTPDKDVYIHLKRFLGSGVYKDVYNCLRIRQGHPELMAEMIIDHHQDMAIREERLAASFDSAYISGKADLTYRTGDRLSMIMELMDGDGCRLQRDPNITASQRIQTMIDVSKGLARLHDAGYAHQDLHAGNILYRKGSQPVGKLSDLGLATRTTPGSEYQAQDLFRLAVLVDKVCGPVFESYPELGASAELRKLARVCGIREMTMDRMCPITAETWMHHLEEYSASLGDIGRETVYALENSPEFEATMGPLKVVVAKPVCIHVTPTMSSWSNISLTSWLPSWQTSSFYSSDFDYSSYTTYDTWLPWRWASSFYSPGFDYPSYTPYYKGIGDSASAAS